MRLLRLRSVPAVLALPALLLALASAPACTGDDPTVTGTTGADGGDASTGTTDGPSSSDTSVPGDANAPACKAPLADCNGDGTCDTSIDNDPKNCGACGHDCGGGTCGGGKCQPQTLMDKLANPVSLAVNTTALVVLSDGGPRVCAKAGCGGAPSTALASGETIANGPHTIFIDEQNAFWLGRTTPSTQFEVRKCAVAGCGLAPTVFDDAQLGTEMHGEGNLMLRYDPTGNVTKLTLDDSVAKQYLGSGTVAPALYFTLAGGKMAFSNSDGATGGARGVYYGDFANVVPTRIMNEGRYVAIQGGVVYASRSADATYDAIYGCAIGGCGGVGAALGGTGPGIQTGKILAMKADASGLYWVERIGTVGRIMRCALPACPGGPQVLAASQDQPVAIVTDAGFVYWVNAGSGTNGTVARIAK